MYERSYMLDFPVTLCLESGDEEDVTATVDVSEEEYQLLKECCRDGEEPDAFDGLEDLCRRVEEAAREESDGDVKSCIIGMPDEIYGAADEDEETSVDWDDYCDCPFAMEVVNGQIISLTEDMQAEIVTKILEKLRVTEEELIQFLVRLEADEDAAESEDGRRFGLIAGYGYDVLVELLGYDEDEEEFAPGDLGFLDSNYGWEAKELLESLGFELEENISHGPHGHDTNGVVYIQDI